MTTITYRDLEKAAPVVTWFGVEFKDGEPVDLDKQEHLTREQRAEMTLRATTSAFYHVEGEQADPDPPGVEEQPTQADPKSATRSKDEQEGRAAADAGAKRDVKKPALWLEGFDERIEELEAEAKVSKNTHPRR